MQDYASGSCFLYSNGKPATETQQIYWNNWVE
jgi:hypothetical protein